ncbi:chromosome segregation protein SMC [Lactococcus raffinolactis]|uniref:chromosome segregation protein SMC n=1 Tax=Pseudolactococcus raffinolactis TaxID=1366 RepID=UPI001C6FE13C|nr:chromosome segregation protein SMC [Lactococcus raffinolactis]MBW9298905.1 chromosome segregation protein SMC [Lactococcus raffinolactis]
MYLKQIEMVGFKSFADRTKITFDTGVTAIVGPNGSGKSNVTESLRWALGEQSAKSLRGAKMPDIIFAGTQKRRALNYAEVIVTFDNADGYLPSEATVVITRRLYRNGDSEFLINGKKVRLKDVHELFTDTGLGRDSFSIISQGKIESIFNSKPEERRAIFEEAAGVLKYKNRKKETESKLSATQENMDRLEDIIYELDGQLTPLRAQRDVALKFRELDARRTQLDISVLVAQIIAEKVSYESAQAQFKDVQETLAQLDAAQEVFERDVLKLKQARSAVERDQEKLQAEILQFTTAKSDFQSKIDIFHSQAQMSQKSAAEREARIASLTSKLTEVSETLAILTDRLETNQAQKATLDAQIQTLQGKLDNFSENPDDVIERLRAEFVDLVNQEAQLSNAITKNTSELDNIRANAASKSDENQALAEKYNNLKTELDATTQRSETLKLELAQLLAQYNTSDIELKTLETAIGQTQNRLFAAMDELNKGKARLTSLENIRASHANFYQGVKAVLQASDKLPGIIGAVADLVSFDKQYATAMDIALAGGAQNIIVSDEQAAKSAINFLRAQRLGRATFLPLTTIKPRHFSKTNQVANIPGFIDTAQNLVSYDENIAPAISNLLGSVLIVDNNDHATQIARALNFTARIVALDGTEIRPGGSFSGGANKKNSTTFTNVEIDDLTQKVAVLDQTVRGFEKDLQELQHQKTSLTTTLTDLRQKGEAARLQSQEYSLKEEALLESKQDLESRLALSNASDEQAVIDKLTLENEAYDASLVTIQEKKTQINTDISEVKSSQSQVKTLTENLRRDLQESQLKLSEVTSDIRHTAGEIKRLTTEQANLEAEIQALTSQQETTISDLDNETRLESLTTHLKAVSDSLEAANIKLVSLRFEREDLTAQIEDLDDANTVNIKQRQDQLAQKTRLELSLETSENRLRSRQNKLVNDYQMSFDAAKEQAEELVSLSESERQLQSLESQIRKLGPINLAAIEQFDEVNERREFLNTQKKDLLKAKALLESTINDMDDEVKVRFKSTFEAIRLSFQKTFTQMFGGGQADLILTSEDLLHAGIEIAVQPPGKKLASLNLMSGGEKSLTALALLFAIIRVRTVPFVVLDEVEAALDEANVKRFGDYMTRFDESSQFIVVTHRKGTMKAAKAMYGVTMQEGGVSKIVSVKLKDFVAADQK